MEAVGVALHRITEPDGRVTELSQQRGGRGGGVVSSEDSLQRLGGRAGCDRVGLDERMGVAVADDDLQVEMVGVPAAGEHGV